MEDTYTIMGIDPGYGRMGFGVVFVERGKSQLVDYGVMSTLMGDAFEDRLLHLANDLNDLLLHHMPALVALEKLFFAKNSKTALAVAEARGVALLLAAQHRVPVVEFTPTQVKKALTGDGNAPKQAVQKMVKEWLSLPRPPKPDDAADALAIALVASTKRW